MDFFFPKQRNSKNVIWKKNARSPYQLRNVHKQQPYNSHGYVLVTHSTWEVEAYKSLNALQSQHALQSNFQDSWGDTGKPLSQNKTNNPKEVKK